MRHSIPFHSGLAFDVAVVFLCPHCLRWCQLVNYREIIFICGGCVYVYNGTQVWCTGKSFGGVGKEAISHLQTDECHQNMQFLQNTFSGLNETTWHALISTTVVGRQLTEFLMDLADSADMIGLSDPGLPKEAVMINYNRAKGVSETSYSWFPQTLLWVLPGLVQDHWMFNPDSSC